MKTKSLLNALFLAFLMGISGMAKIHAQTFTVGDLNYSINDDGVSVTVIGHVNGTQATGQLIIPTSVSYNGNNYTVTIIGTDAFYDSHSLTSLSIPNTITVIKARAFANCTGFTGSLIIPNSVITIGRMAFVHCVGFTGSLTIPNSVESIGENAFATCYGFDGTLTIGNSMENIERGVFQSCSGFSGSLIIPNSVKNIGDNAFSFCSGFTGTLTIPNSIKHIGSGALARCSGIMMIAIPNSVVEIWKSSFYGTGWYNNQPDGVLYLDNWCLGWKGDETPTTGLILNNGIVGIAAKAFYGIHSFTGSVIIPNTVRVICDEAFYNCCGFDGSLTIGNSVEIIGNDAFRYCNGFTGTLILGNSVESIGSRAFQGCYGFTGSLSIPNSVQSIDSYAFNGCSGFNGTLNLGNSLENIGIGAFESCSGFTGSLTIPNSVKIIEDQAFEACSGFTGTLNIGNSVESIGVSTYDGCCGFTGSLTIPNSVVSIGWDAFNSCYGFTGTLTIGNSIDTIYNEAFKNCAGFNNVVSLSLTPPGILNNVFEGINENCNLSVPCGLTDVYNQANWAYNFNSVIEDCTDYSIVVECDIDDVITAPNSAKMGEEVTFVDNSICGLIDHVFICKLNDETQILETIGNSFIMPNYDVKIKVIINENNCIDNLIYIKDTGGVSAKVMAHKDGSQAAGAIIIPDFIICNDTHYPVTAIAPNAFNGCSGITSLSVGEHVATIGPNAFSGCNNITTLNYNCPANILDYINKTSIVTLNIGNQVTSIPDYSFNNCTNLTTLTIGNSVTYIGQSAFNNCTGLLSAIIPDAVTEIRNNSFHNCTNLTVASIGNGVTTIGNDAFNGCLQLMSFSLGEGIETIGDRAFMNCGIIGDIIVGQNVSYIGNESFKNCYGISEITSLRIAAPLLGNDTFDGINPDISIYIPCGSTNLYAGRWSYFHNFNEIPFLFRAVSEDETKGIVVIMSAPTCESPQALVRAIAHPSYQFDHWSDGSTSNPYVYQVTGSVTLIAYFKSLVGEEENQEIPVSIYPNPTNGIVKIETENIQNISIYNIFGAKVFSESTNGDSFEYDFSKHHAGIYIIRVETAQGTVTKQIAVK